MLMHLSAFKRLQELNIYQSNLSVNQKNYCINYPLLEHVQITWNDGSINPNLRRIDLQGIFTYAFVHIVVIEIFHLQMG